MRVPPSSESKPPAAPATAFACSSNPRPWLRAVCYLAPLLTLSLYARSFWLSPAFSELADQGYHLELGHAFAEAWHAGEFPPAWSATANGGRGSPAFQLYPPLFAFLTACWMRLLGPAAEALRWSAFSAVLFDFAAIYWAARGCLTPRRALVAASVALALPGATFVGLGRGMFPNFLALGWAALAAGSAKRGSIPLLALAAAGLILTHTPTAYLVSLTTLALIVAPASRPVAPTSRVAFLAASLLALAATAWFWLPMLQLSQHVQTGYLTQSHPYAESLWFATRPTATAFQQDWAFLNETATYIGLAQLALALALFVLSRQRALLAVATLTLAASLWPTGEWLTLLPHYASVQFCWRWQPLLSLACGMAFASLPARTALRQSPVLALVIGFFLPLAAPSPRAPGQQPNLASNLIEMRPPGAGHELFPPGPPCRTEVLSGACRAIPVDIRPSSRTYHVTADTACQLRILTYHFPAWTATLDDAAVPIETGPSALQIITVPKGLHTLSLHYRPKFGIY